MKIVVVDYNPQWKAKFDKEAELIKQILSDEVVEIHHIGSTSVEGLKAKPIIDIMPVVKNLEKVDDYSAEFESIGYEVMGEFGMSGRRYFRKGGDDRTHQIHMFQEGDTHNIIRHLAVRDYLRAHPAVADKYGNLKAKLAKEHPRDIEGYGDGKEEFMIDLENKALIWYDKQE